MYGFTQLKDGKLAFMGLKASISDSGLWVFVTDSTGKDLLWEKQYNLPGTDLGGNKLNNILPYSICATPDGGFTVVGDNNTTGDNHNACALHFILKSVSTVSIPQSGSFTTCHTRNIISRTNGSKIIISITEPQIKDVHLTVYNAAGVIVARISECKNIGHITSFTWSFSNVISGVYFCSVATSEHRIYSGRLVVGK